MTNLAYEVRFKCAVCEVAVHGPYTHMPGENYAVCSEDCLELWINMQVLLGWYPLDSGSHYEIATKTRYHWEWRGNKDRRNCYYTGRA